MALVKCPECGREKVSDSADMCPDCGYAIKAYYDKVKQEEEEKRLAEEREKQRIAEEEERKRLQQENEKRKQEAKEKWFGTPIKKFAWVLLGCLLFGLVIAYGCYASNQAEIAEAIEDSQSDIQKIEGFMSSIDSEIGSADYVYGSIASDAAVENITEHLDDIRMYMSFVDLDYKKDTKVSEAIDTYVIDNTSTNSWEEYKQYITDEYFVGSTNEESAGKLVKGSAYSSNDEMIEERKNNSVIIESLNHTSSGSNYKVYGTVTNNTSYTVKFVKVKVSMKDADGKVIDTETTYACGDEGLKPGESTKFDCYIKKDSKTKSFSAEIYEYD